MKLAFIGGGNMATALIGGLLKKGWRPQDIAVVEIDAQARERLNASLTVRTYADLEPALEGAHCVLLAVKPQHMRDAARSLARLIGDRLVVSIAAGIRIADLSRWLGGHGRIVRAMPNTPALVLAGMTGLYAPPTVVHSDRANVEQILAVAGATLWVEEEKYIDGVTALSGSGPAYVFYFIEALEQAAGELGFDETASRRLALETVKGAVKLADETADDVKTLRARVTSKGGTTERALSILEGEGARDAIVHAVLAAAKRSRELGEAFANDADAA